MGFHVLLQGQLYILAFVGVVPSMCNIKEASLLLQGLVFSVPSEDEVPVFSDSSITPHPLVSRVQHRKLYPCVSGETLFRLQVLRVSKGRNSQANVV
jgi:hypothetical protein